MVILEQWPPCRRTRLQKLNSLLVMNIFGRDNSVHIAELSKLDNPLRVKPIMFLVIIKWSNLYIIRHNEILYDFTYDIISGNYIAESCYLWNDSQNFLFGHVHQWISTTVPAGGKVVYTQLRKIIKTLCKLMRYDYYSALVSISCPKALYHLESENIFRITVVVADWLGLKSITP